MQRLIDRRRLHDVTFSRDGRMRIGSRLTRMLGLRAGDCVGLAEDDGDFLIYGIREAEGRCVGRLHSSKRGGRTLCGNSVELCRRLLDLAGVMEWRGRFAAGECIEIEGRVYARLIKRLTL